MHRGVREGFVAQLGAHAGVAAVVVGLGALLRSAAAATVLKDRVKAYVSELAEEAVGAWAEMIPAWWRGWIVGVASAAVVFDVAGLAEQRFASGGGGPTRRAAACADRKSVV